MEKIIIKKINNQWHAKSNDPRLFDLFGTDTLPLGYSPSACPKMIVKEIKERSPSALVLLEGIDA